MQGSDTLTELICLAEQIDQASVESLKLTVKKSIAEIEKIYRERDAFQQELFESNRYAAYLSNERQKLLETSRSNETHFNLQLRQREYYAGQLEEMMWQSESQRLALAFQLERTSRSVKLFRWKSND